MIRRNGPCEAVFAFGKCEEPLRNAAGDVRGNRGFHRQKPVGVKVGRAATGDGAVGFLIDEFQRLGIQLPLVDQTFREAGDEKARVGVAGYDGIDNVCHGGARDDDVLKKSPGVDPLVNHFDEWNLPAGKRGFAHDGDSFPLEVGKRSDVVAVAAGDDGGAVAEIGVGRPVRCDGQKRNAVRAADHETREAA